MNRPFQLDAHVDAESLNAFVERALPEPERLHVLSHIAVCGHCREVLFLAQQAAEVEIEMPVSAAVRPSPHHPAPVPRISGPLKSWLGGWRFAWIPAMACAAIVGIAAILFLLRPGHPTDRTQVARSTGSLSSSNPVGFVIPAVPVKRPDTGSLSLKSSPQKSNLDTARAGVSPRQTSLLPEMPVSNQSATLGSVQSAAPVDSAGTALQQMQSAQNQKQPGVIPAIQNQTTTVEVSAAPLTVAADDSVTTTLSAAQLNPVPLRERNAVSTAANPKYKMHSVAAQSPPAAPQSAAATSHQSQAIPPAASAFESKSPVRISAGAPLTMQSMAAANGTALTKKSGPTDAVVARTLLFTRLPDGKIAVSAAAAQHRLLAVDSTGSVFLSEDEGKQWQPVAPQWSGKAIEVRVQPLLKNQLDVAKSVNQTVSVTPAPCASCTEAQPANPVSAKFELITDTVTVWTSDDGKSWKRK